MSSYKTQAIIINRLNLGESDRILTLFSPTLGKFKAVAKGARKTKSKFGGHTELFTQCEFVITKGKGLDTITDSDLLQNFLASSPDIDKVKTVYYFGEIINKILPEESVNNDVYQLFVFCLENINKVDVRLLQLIFIAKLLLNLGIYPELSNCVACERKPENNNVHFSKSTGGILDQNCALRFDDSIKTDEDTIKLWRYIAGSTLVNTTKIKVKPETILSASAMAIEYIQCVTMIDAKSLRVLS